jgi:hypothetical protein
MPQANGICEVGWVDCAGGGQIVVEKGIAYVGHMAAPHGTSIFDARDPKNVKHLSSIEVPKGTHSHKVHAQDGIMVVNRERAGTPPEDWHGGFEVYDISDLSKPKSIYRWQTAGTGMHRFSFDGRYLYGSPTFEGFVGNVMGIFDLQDPAKPELVGRWWMPGQWTAGGETPTWKGTNHRCHHPLRLGNRLYTSYWHGGFVILDIDDMAKPKLVSGLDWSPPYPCPTHSAVPVPFEIAGRRILLVADEDVAHMNSPAHRVASGWWTSRWRTGRCRLHRSRSRRSTTRPTPSTSAVISRSRRSLARSFPPPGSPTACASSTSRGRARRRKSRASSPTRRRAPIIA